MNKILLKKITGYIFFRKTINRRKLPLTGSSIIEVVVAMFIISMSIALTASLFSSVFSSSQRYVKLGAWFKINQWVNDCKVQHDRTPMSTNFETYIIEKSVEQVDESQRLWQIKIEATSPKGKVLANRKFIIEAE